MNETDLRALLSDRATPPDDLAGAIRFAQVKGRVMARRRRWGTAAAAGLVVAVLGLASVIASPKPGSTEPAQDPNPMIGGFRQYQDGAVVVATASVDLPTRVVTVTAVPRTETITFRYRCTGAERFVIVLTVNGQQASSGTCGDSGSGLVFGKRTPGQAGLIKVGEPLVVSMTTTGTMAGSADSPLPDSGSLHLAIAEAVAPADYPYPPRPATQALLNDLSHLPALADIRADPADPDRRGQVVLTWPGAADIIAAMNTPGALRILINDVEVHRLDSWDFSGNHSAFAQWDHWIATSGLRLEPGQQVTITVIPERATGDWRVGLFPPAPGR